MNRFACSIIVMLTAAGVVSWAKATPSHQPTGPVEIDDYWLRVQETLSAIDALEQADPAAVRSSLDAQAAEWEAIQQVRLADGAVVPVNSSYLVGLLRADPADLDALRQYLRTLLDEKQNLRSSSSSRSAADDRAALAAILARKEFTWETVTRNPLQEWLDNLVQHFLDWLNRSLPFLNGGGSRIIQWVMGVIGALALVLILVNLLRGLTGSMSDEAAWPDGDDGLSEILSAEAAARRAEETARVGDYRSAVRWLYLSSLLVLEERGLLRYDRTHTNREYLRSVAHLPELAAILRDVIDVFDQVWYGIVPISEADFARYAARVADLRRLQ